MAAFTFSYLLILKKGYGVRNNQGWKESKRFIDTDEDIQYNESYKEKQKVLGKKTIKVEKNVNFLLLQMKITMKATKKNKRLWEWKQSRLQSNLQ